MAIPFKTNTFNGQGGAIGGGGLSGYTSSGSGIDLSTSSGLYALAQMNGGAVSEVANDLVHPEKSFLSRAWNVLGSATSTILNTLAIPQNVVAGIISPDITVREAIKEKIRPSEVIFGEADPNAQTYQKVGGWVVREATDILLDPTTYLTAGYGQSLLGARATSKIAIGEKMRPVTDAGQAFLTSAWSRQRDGVTKTLLKVARGNGKKYQEFVDDFLKFRPDMEDAVRSGVVSDELEQRFINKFLEKTIDQNQAKESLAKIVMANPDMARVYLDQGGIKYFGRSIISGQKLGEAFSAIPGVRLLDEFTAPARRLIGATFNRNIDFKHGRIPDEVLALEDKWKDFGRTGAITATRTLKNIVDSFGLSVQEAEILMGNLEYGIIPADDRLARAWAAARDFDFDELVDLRNAGYKTNNKENHIPHIFAEDIKSSPIPFSKPPKTVAIASLERKAGETVAEAELAGYRFEKNPFVAVAKRSLDNNKAITSSHYVKELGEKYGYKASEAPKGYITIKIPGIKNIQEDSARGGALSLSDFIRHQNGEELFFHPAIADRASSFIGSVVNDEATKEWLKKLDSFNNLWKASQTVIWPAFHGRNGISNVLQNFLDIGVHAFDPKKNAMAVSIILDDIRLGDFERAAMGTLRRESELLPEITEIPIKTELKEVTKPISRSRLLVEDRQFIDSVRSTGALKKDKLLTRMDLIRAKALEKGIVKDAGGVDWDSISDEVSEMFSQAPDKVEYLPKESFQFRRARGKKVNWLTKKEVKQAEIDKLFEFDDFVNIPVDIKDESGKIIRKSKHLPLKELAETRETIDRTLNLSGVSDNFLSGNIDAIDDVPLNLSPQQEDYLMGVVSKFRKTDGSKKSFIEALTGKNYSAEAAREATRVAYRFNIGSVDEMYDSVAKIVGKEDFVEEVVERVEIPTAFIKVFKGRDGKELPRFIDLPGTLEARQKFSELLLKHVLTDATGKKWTMGELRSVIRELGIALNPHYTGAADISRTNREFANSLFGEDTILGKINKLNPGSKDNIALRAGKTVARIVEDQGRLVNFLTNLEKTGDVQLAAERTKMFLFDYDNISDFERTWLKRFIPFYCVPEDSLALTKDGWKHYSDIIIGEELLTYNNDKDEYEWQPCLEVASFEHDQELMVIENSRHKLRFTPEHRWVTESGTIKRGYELNPEDSIRVKPGNAKTLKVGKTTMEHYTGVVWCPRTENGTWVMKQGGLITITGNTFTRKNLELQAKSIMQTPGRIQAMNTSVQNLGEVFAGGDLSPDEEKALPEWMKNGMKFALRRKDGHINIAASLGTPLEAAAQSIQPRQLLSSLTPVLRVPLELTTGQDIFRGKAISSVTDADAYRFAPKVIQDFIGYTKIDGTFKGKPYVDYRALRPERMHLLNNLPYSGRAVAALKAITAAGDGNIPYGYFVLQQLTGVKVYDVDLERSAATNEKELRDELSRILDEADVVATFKRTFIPKNK